MFDIFRTSSFKSDYKKLDTAEKEQLKALLLLLIHNKTLDKKYKNHPLLGNHKGCMECHIKPDLLLIYKIQNDINELQLVRVGSHSNLFS